MTSRFLIVPNTFLYIRTSTVIINSANMLTSLVLIFKSLIQIDKKVQVNLFMPPFIDSINGHYERNYKNKGFIIIKGHVDSDHKLCVLKDQYTTNSLV